MHHQESFLKPIARIAAHFNPAATAVSPLGNGLINDTFLVATPVSAFVLQRINRRVFPKPELIMKNLDALNKHIEGKTGEPVKLQVPAILTTRNDELCFYDGNGDCWRALSFLPDSESLETITNLNDAGQAGFALGHFHCLVSDLDPSALQDTLPGFHITPDYLAHYHEVSKRLPADINSDENRYCRDFIGAFQHRADILETAKNQGLLPMRIIHGDPKLNNFLFDRHSGRIVGIIDLDTVKPGLVHYDIGDCLRSCCHNLATDSFDLDICTALLTTYIAEAKAFFTKADYRFLYPAIELIPFELGLRFYTDYLEGNRYFKVSGPEQNLQRAGSQFRLCENIMAKKNRILQLIDGLQISVSP